MIIPWSVFRRLRYHMALALVFGGPDREAAVVALDREIASLQAADHG